MSETPHTETTESDPNADSPEGLQGGMGVSSERPGPIRGKDVEATYASAPTHTGDDPEVGADLDEIDANYPAPVGEPNEFDPDRNPRHG